MCFTKYQLLFLCSLKYGFSQVLVKLVNFKDRVSHNETERIYYGVLHLIYCSSQLYLFVNTLKLCNFNHWSFIANYPGQTHSIIAIVRIANIHSTIHGFIILLIMVLQNNDCHSLWFSTLNWKTCAVKIFMLDVHVEFKLHLNKHFVFGIRILCSEYA